MLLCEDGWISKVVVVSCYIILTDRYFIHSLANDDSCIPKILFVAEHRGEFPIQLSACSMSQPCHQEGMHYEYIWWTTMQLEMMQSLDHALIIGQADHHGNVIWHMAFRMSNLYASSINKKVTNLPSKYLNSVMCLVLATFTPRTLPKRLQLPFIPLKMLLNIQINME